MLDTIYISDLFLRCIVGINEDERHKKQDVNINITLHADLSKACKTDHIEDTVDYTLIRDHIVDLVENSSFFLIEALAEKIAEICLEAPLVEAVRVSVEKPRVLRFARTVGIEIYRRKEPREKFQ